MRVKYRVFFTAPLLFNPQLPKLLLNICSWNQHLEQKGSQPTSWHWASRSVRFGRLRPFCEDGQVNLFLFLFFFSWEFAPHRWLCRPLVHSMVFSVHIVSPTGKYYDLVLSEEILTEAESSWQEGKPDDELDAVISLVARPTQVNW